MSEQSLYDRAGFDELCDVREMIAQAVGIVILGYVITFSLSFLSLSLESGEAFELVSKAAAYGAFIFRLSVLFLVPTLALEPIMCFAVAWQAKTRTLTAAMTLFALSSSAIVVASTAIVYWGWQLLGRPGIPVQWFPGALSATMRHRLLSFAWWVAVFHIVLWGRMLAGALNCVGMAIEFKSRAQSILAVAAVAYFACWSAAAMTFGGYVPAVWPLVAGWPLYLVYPAMMLLAVPFELLLHRAFDEP